NSPSAISRSKASTAGRSDPGYTLVVLSNTTEAMVRLTKGRRAGLDTIRGDQVDGFRCSTAVAVAQVRVAGLASRHHPSPASKYFETSLGGRNDRTSSATRQELVSGPNVAETSARALA